MTTRTTLLLYFFLGAAGISAQPGWQWPADSTQSAKAKEYYALYSDLSKENKPAEALPYLEWLLERAPDLHVSLYIGAAATFEDLAEAASDPAEKLRFQERVLEAYDTRLQYFNHEGEVLNRKAFAAYKFFKDDKARYPALIELFSKANTLNGADAFDNNLIALMDILRRLKLSGGSISDEQVINYYNEIGDILDAKIAAGRKESAAKVSEIVDQIIADIVKMDCGFVEQTFGPKMKQDPSNADAARKLFKLLLAGKCVESPSFYPAAEAVQLADPSYGVARILAAKRAADGDYGRAIAYYKEALALTGESGKKAETLVDIAKVYATQGEKGPARTHAMEAAGYDPQNTEAYNLVGNLYFQSYDDCREGVSRVKDRAVFIAAYGMYRKAGNTKGMEEAKGQFPSIGEIFEEGMQEGDKITLTCWVNETVVLQKR